MTQPSSFLTDRVIWALQRNDDPNHCGEFHVCPMHGPLVGYPFVSLDFCGSPDTPVAKLMTLAPQMAFALFAVAEALRSVVTQEQIHVLDMADRLIDDVRREFSIDEKGTTP